jgi:hypothetical protein
LQLDTIALNASGVAAGTDFETDAVAVHFAIFDWSGRVDTAEDVASDAFDIALKFCPVLQQRIQRGVVACESGELSGSSTGARDGPP